MKMKNIKNIVNDAKFGDLVILEIPSGLMTSGGMLYGDDYAAGFFSQCDDKNVYLNNIQKLAYKKEDPIAYPIDDITSYKILLKYELNPEEDGLDEIISSYLDDLVQ